MEDKPLLAITMGDPAGIGPEVIARAWTSPAIHEVCRPFAIGHPELLRRARDLVAGMFRVQELDTPEDAAPSADVLPCLPCGAQNVLEVQPASIDARGGQAAFDAVHLAVDLAISQRIHAITTAPLNKAALRAAGCDFPGHTELLADACGVEQVAMMLYLPPGDRVVGPAGLGVAHVTLHTALSEIFDQITPDAVFEKIGLADDVFRRLIGAGGRSPQIGVCALNPHAGEQGLFGCEEATIIQPAVDRARSASFQVTGPLPADTLMVRAAAGDFDAVVAMYHDQGHIALKLLGMHRAVNITLGLPIIRTSVAHGTAFDLAWQGRARCDGMIEAVRVAAQLARRKSESKRDGVLS